MTTTLRPAKAPNQASLAKLDWSLHAARPMAPHAIHPYPAKFIPQLAELCLTATGMDGPIIDPFCGSGTTLVEAQRIGIDAVGVDLNPVACLISRVKTMRPNEATLDACRDLASRIAHDADVDMWEAPRVDHWFSDGARRFLAAAKADIARLGEPHIEAILRLAVCRIMVSISRQESDTRYAAVENEIDAQTSRIRFVGAVEAVCDQLNEYVATGDRTSSVHVIEADSRGLSKCGFENASFGGAVFSPPYPNAYEYWLYHKYRAYWLDCAPTAVRDLEIGARPHYSKPNNLTAADFARDLTPVFEELWRMIRPSGSVAVVVGDSVIKGELVDNGALVKQVATEAGFSVMGHVDRTLPEGRRSFRANRLRTEHVLFFQRGNA